jgi:NAD-dependent SIR2 family protein deacetylase
MSYKNIKCSNCKNNFVWSDEEQIIYQQRGLVAPEYCPICRGIIEARSRDVKRSKYER